MSATVAFLDTLFHDALVLFAMVNAVGNLPLFADLTRGLPSCERAACLRRGTLTAAGIVIAFALFGHWMLADVFRVEAGAFQIAGGVLVFTVAARGMLLGPKSAVRSRSRVSDDLAVFPLGFPYLAGPGTIVTTILLMQAHGPLSAALAALLVYAAVLPVLHAAPLLERAAGKVSVLVVARILYIFIAAKAVAFIVNGARSLLAAAPAV
ncbi:MAG: MarC family protein [Acidobacteriota bacterium]